MKLQLQLLTLATIFAFHFTLKAQSITAFYYPFSVSTGTVTPSSGFTSLIGASNTNGVSPLTSFGNGFEFNFSGKTFTSFCVSTSGWIRLGAVGTQYFSPVLNNSINYPVISPYQTSLNTSSTGSVGFKLIGTAPHRVCVVQWHNVMHTPYIVTPVTFEARLFESSGLIQFVYGNIVMNNNGYATGLGATFNSINSYVSVNVATPASTSIAQYNSNAISTSSIASGTLFQFAPDSIPPAVAVNPVSAASAACITLDFDDNSTTETYFEIWRSLDSINYSFLKMMISTSESSTGTVYSYTDTSLQYNTIYHYRILAHNFGGTPVQWLAITDTTTFPSLIGVKQIPGDYSSIAMAFDDIKCKRLAGPLILELMSSYSPSVETYPIIFLGDTFTSPANTITLRPDTHVTGLSFVQTISSTVFDFNKSSNIIIDGRPAGMGNTNVLSIINNSDTGSVLRFVNDAKNIRIQYCNVYGSDTVNPNGVINIAGTNYVNGNDHLVFDHCDLSRSTYTARNIIYSLGTIGKSNDSITVSNCTIRDFNRFGTPSQTTSGIYVGDANNDWTIVGNSFYHTITFNITADLTYVYVNNPLGNNFIINNNFFGGSAPLCAGSSGVYNGSGSLEFLLLKGGSAKTSLIEGNVLDNITISASASNPIIRGIQVSGGKVDIGSFQGNRVGNENGTYSIFLNTGNMTFIGIDCRATDTATVANNTVGGIYGAVTVGTHHDVTGIYASRSIYLRVHHNLVGHPVYPNSILIQSVGEIRGIIAEAFLNGANAYVDSNIVANLSLQNSVNQYNNNVGGITCHEGTAPGTIFNLHITHNRIYNLSSSARETGPGIWLTGIYFSHYQGVGDISDNDIYNLIQTAPLCENVSGIGTYCTSTGTTAVERNFIHSLSAPNATSISSRIDGIGSSNGRDLICNNMIQLGIQSDSSNYRGASSLRGIYADTPNNAMRKNIFHNSIYIGGMNHIPNETSFGIYIYGTSPDSIFNNILCNERNDSIVNQHNHYGLLNSSNTQLKSNYNLYYVTSNAGCYANNYSSFAAWQATGQDLNSYIGDPAFIDPNGDSVTANLHVSPITWAEGLGYNFPNIPIDIDHDLRSTFSPVDIGADCGNFLNTGNAPQENSNPIAEFPNPFTDKLTLVFPDNAAKEFHIELYDAWGNLLLQEEITLTGNEYELNELGKFSSGYYFITISGENYFSTAKVSKVN